MSVVSDPIADMLTRIRNAGMARRTETTMPSSKILVEIAKILQQEGYIRGWEVQESKPFNNLIVYLKYASDRRHSIRNIRRVSKPGLRVYAGKDEIPRVRNGLGIAILSTPQGVITGQEARRRGIGGEILCTVY
ncbi:MAG TPA: 30S ribosomal protein S8 [Thermomicrobiales bacterium]|jgi:small subunit ribosomal protein S8|nr:30S ribosomal protein S8 [Thermomicrobiales bacterium]